MLNSHFQIITGRKVLLPEPITDIREIGMTILVRLDRIKSPRLRRGSKRNGLIFRALD